MYRCIEVTLSDTQEKLLYWSDLKVFKDKTMGDYVLLKNNNGDTIKAPSAIKYSLGGVVTRSKTFRRIG